MASQVSSLTSTTWIKLWHIIFRLTTLDWYKKTLYVSDRIIQPRRATVHELSAFHSMDYIECLQKLTNCDDCEEMEETASDYGLGLFNIMILEM